MMDEATAVPSTFKWLLWPTHWDFPASDDFLVGEFRVRLMGHALELSYEGSAPCSPDSANALAERYIEALNKRVGMPVGLITEDEFLARTTPPFGGMIRTISASRESRGRTERAVRAARNELLASADQTLRRCYDYLQDARECLNVLDGTGGEAADYAAYKAMEVLKERFGGDAKAKAALGSVYEKAKRAANEERHIPRKGQPQSTASGRSVELAKQAIQAYERYLLTQP